MNSTKLCYYVLVNWWYHWLWYCSNNVVWSEFLHEIIVTHNSLFPNPKYFGKRLCSSKQSFLNAEPWTLFFSHRPTLICSMQQSPYVADKISENSITNSISKYTIGFPGLVVGRVSLPLSSQRPYPPPSLSFALSPLRKIKSKNNYYLNFSINNYIIRLWFCLQQRLFAHCLLLCVLC